MGSEWGREGQGGTLIPGSTARVWLGIINYKRRDMINKGCVIALETKTSDQEARAVSDAPAIYCSCHRLERHISFLNLCKLERREIKKIYIPAPLSKTQEASQLCQPEVMGKVMHSWLSQIEPQLFYVHTQPRI